MHSWCCLTTLTYVQCLATDTYVLYVAVVGDPSCGTIRIGLVSYTMLILGYVCIVRICCVRSRH